MTKNIHANNGVAAKDYDWSLTIRFTHVHFDDYERKHSKRNTVEFSHNNMPAGVPPCTQK